jgi:transposase-like protein
MRYPATEKLEIIRLVEQSHLSVRRTLAKIGIPPTTFYRWYDRFVEHGPEGLEDRPSSPSRAWNRIPEAVRDRIVKLALQEPELSPRELAVRFTHTEKYFVSAASVYRLLKSHDLITSPTYIVIKGEGCARHWFATEWLWTYNNERPNMGIGGLTPAMKLKMAA